MTTAHIAPAADAQVVLPDDEKAAAEAEAAAEAAENAPNERYILYVVPGRAAANRVDPETGKKLDTKSSGEPHAHASRAVQSTYASRVGIGSAVAQYTPQDWAKLGIKGDTVVWDFRNNWRVALDTFTKPQLRHLLIEDRAYNGIRFELVDGDGNKVDG